MNRRSFVGALSSLVVAGSVVTGMKATKVVQVENAAWWELEEELTALAAQFPIVCTMTITVNKGRQAQSGYWDAEIAVSENRDEQGS